MDPNWNPPQADQTLLAGDESAIETIAFLLATLPASARGQVFIEVGTVDDVGCVSAPGRFTVTWLVRASGQSLGRSVDAWLSEMLADFGPERSIYAWIASEGPARLITS